MKATAPLDLHTQVAHTVSTHGKPKFSTSLKAATGYYKVLQTDQARAEQIRAERRTEQSRADHSRPDQSRLEQSRKEQSSADQQTRTANTRAK